MINAIGLRWILTALFIVPALHALWLTATSGRAPTNRVGHALHAVMGILMVAMAWPWGMDLPAGPGIVVFSAGALWFTAAAAVRSWASGAHAAALPAALPHIVMMAAMAWMSAVMNGSAGSSGVSGGGHDMPGMDMSGAGAASAMTLSRAGDQWTAGLLAVALVALGLRWLAQAFDRGRVAAPAAPPGTAALVSRTEALEPACHAAMALGMGVMFVLLV
ncbi:DUF5134 domain-containing protein [Streptomyces nodosus]|uniref:DUF5134 domain-containing protein n=1 Tax=Streptomyces nodosus TaxID=40318 RepID=A0A0B5DV27_9ACTN|nr:DUF5134 domain-containing protein [Streptomyces nodosus]AJE44042.1 hypothetical protein SNOD_31635 [Streptomyces nodosus]MBB4795621.1 hypothetical protein [Streptomyces nodosus]QEV42533.1 DUF5134 domain-containing protein [Streptomyces nodosus]